MIHLPSYSTRGYVGGVWPWAVEWGPWCVDRVATTVEVGKRILFVMKQFLAIEEVAFSVLQIRFAFFGLQY